TRLDVGYGIVLESITLENDRLDAGDTLRGSFCWKAPDEIPFGLPIEWTMRLDTEYPKGLFFRSWYSKQYRRAVERRKSRSYRLTRTGRLMSGFTFPDQWGAGEKVRQVFSIALPRSLEPGIYDMRIKVKRAPYLSNRTIPDYFLNEDSMQGDLVARIRVNDRRGLPERRY
ncbi:MAG: hypothetical protein KAX38_05425, partial [Candidatus Krumholzibacteria bacterium]|nr:hypothetical protein [Candidatus Krumholzibacteria bacterium]